MTRFILETANSNAGGSSNVAQTVFHCDLTVGPVTQDQVAASLVAFAQYMLPAGGCTIERILVGADAPGPTLPLPFPTLDYAVLALDDADLDAGLDYGVPYGALQITALGVGAVLTKRSMTPGRTGRGRLTTPWLPVSWVDSNGSLGAGGATIITNGFLAYLMGDTTAIAGQTSVWNCAPYIYPSMSPIVNVTVSDRLGRLRSRTG